MFFSPRFPLCRCVMVSTPLILRCEQRHVALRGSSSSPFVFYSFLAVMDVPVMAYDTEIKLCRVNGETDPYSTRTDQWGNCRVAMVTDADVTIFITKPVNYVHTARCKSVCLTEPLCHSDAELQIMKLHCCLHSLLIASRHRAVCQPLFPRFFFFFFFL